MRDSNRTKRRRPGFMMLDLLIAMMILTVAMLAFTEMVTLGAWVAQKTRMERIAAACAQDWVRESIGGSYGSLGSDVDLTAPLSQYRTTPLPNPTVRFIVRPLDNNPANTRIREVWVIITWQHPGNGAVGDGSVTAYGVLTVKP